MTANALRKRSKDLLYEIEMLCALATYFESGVVDNAVRGLEGDGIVVRNAVIEAFQLHARQLIDFLSGSDSRDMHAWDFTKTTWSLERTKAQRADFDGFSQRVVHLSLKRAAFTPADQRVETRRIRRELGADIRRFLEAVDDERVCDGFVSRARAALSASEPISDLLDARVSVTTSSGEYSGGTAVEVPREGMR